jgi:hypothetical protein
MTRFQNDPQIIQWKIHLDSPVDKVYLALTSNQHQQNYWAETVIQKEDLIEFHFHHDIKTSGYIIEQINHKKFVVSYFGWKVSFTLNKDTMGGTDFRLCCEGVEQPDREEIIAGWVSWLMAFKAYVDFGVDLRNHDPKRCWFNGYCDN